MITNIVYISENRIFELLSSIFLLVLIMMISVYLIKNAKKLNKKGYIIKRSIRVMSYMLFFGSLIFIIAFLINLPGQLKFEIEKKMCLKNETCLTVEGYVKNLKHKVITSQHFETFELNRIQFELYYIDHKNQYNHKKPNILKQDQYYKVYYLVSQSDTIIIKIESLEV